MSTPSAFENNQFVVKKLLNTKSKRVEFGIKTLAVLQHIGVISTPNPNRSDMALSICL